MASRIKKLRMEKGFSQLDVYTITGIDQSDLSKIERGIKRLNMHQAIELANLYETSIDYLAGITDETMPYPKNFKDDL